MPAELRWRVTATANTADTDIAVQAGIGGGRLPADWDSMAAELYAMLQYLRHVERTAKQGASRERVLILTDCRSAAEALEAVRRQGSAKRGSRPKSAQCTMKRGRGFF